MPNPDTQHFHDAASGTLSYVISDPVTSKAAVVDPLLGFCMASGRTDRGLVDAICNYLASRKLQLEWILETHAHADHLSAAQVLKARLGGKVGIGEGICSVQENFAGLFNLKAPFCCDGSQFDRLFAANDPFAIGSLSGRVLATPGHTSDSVTYVVGNAAFIGDTLFMPDVGTARCDFPGGDAGLLYDSIQSLLSLPPDTLLYLCHDYPPDGRDMRYRCSIDEQRASNMHIGGGRSKREFISLRQARDRTLSPPALILPAIQVNIRAGNVPEHEDNAVSYLKIPLNRF
ncbi:MAG TPA: MBL fold metallo-hydrolase [Woeseiaceae bacterium]|jgi:glyoxylase-like metal-dependent hydrolase (beta-lactamase superfamily II)